MRYRHELKFIISELFNLFSNNIGERSKILERILQWEYT